MASQYHTFSCNAPHLGAVTGGCDVTACALDRLEATIICKARGDLRVRARQPCASGRFHELWDDGLEPAQLFACRVGLAFHYRFRILRNRAAAAICGLVLPRGGEVFRPRRHYL